MILLLSLIVHSFFLNVCSLNKYCLFDQGNTKHFSLQTKDLVGKLSTNKKRYQNIWNNLNLYLIKLENIIHANFS